MGEIDGDVFEYAKSLKAIHEELKKIKKQQKDLKNDYKKQLKGLINVTGLYNHLNSDLESWYVCGIVEVYNVDEKINGYNSYQCVRIKDDSDNKLYMVQPNSDIKGVTHNCVWQTTGYLGDDYSGYLLFPLSNGKYFKIEYTC